MATTLRIATFNLENFDDPGPGVQPSLAARVALMRPQMERLRADILCLQEVNTKQWTASALCRAGRVARRHAVRRVRSRVYDVAAGTMALDVRNLVTLSRFPIPIARSSTRSRRARLPPRTASGLTLTMVGPQWRFELYF